MAFAGFLKNLMLIEERSPPKDASPHTPAKAARLLECLGSRQASP
jgi:hypothetical protein